MQPKVILVIGLAAFLCAHPPAAAAVDAHAVCKEKKAKATGKKAAEVLKAFGKNAKKPNATKLAADISKAESKFTKAFTKQEAKGGCQRPGDGATIRAMVNAFVTDTVISIGGCGNGNLDPGEQCDDSNRDAGDHCDGRCLNEEIEAGADTVTTDTEGPGGTPDGAQAEDAVETTVTSPNPGPIGILETSTTVVPPPGFTLAATQVEITAPIATPTTPLVLVFGLDASLGTILDIVQLELIRVFRDGIVVPACTGGPGEADPDPCVAGRQVIGAGDVEITVLATEASTWTFGAPVTIPSPATPTNALVFDGTDLFVVEGINGAGSVFQVNPTDGSVIDSFMPPSQTILGMTLDPAGDGGAGSLFTTASAPTSSVIEYDKAGGLVGSFSAGSFRAAGLAFDGVSFYIGDVDTALVRVTDASGTPVTSFSMPAGRATAMEFDAMTGYLFVVNGGDTVIRVIETDGDLVDAYPGPYETNPFGNAGITIVGARLYVAGATTPGGASDTIFIIEGTCGDGRVGPGEECDDGNEINGDGCSASCQLP
jgi:cysteine-rich repeat protein